MAWYGESNTDETIRSYFPNLSYSGTFIEIGAAGPTFLSLSRHFKESGWETIEIEANPKFVKAQKESGNRVVDCAVSDYNAEEVDFSIFEASQWFGGVITMEAASALKPYSHVEADLAKGQMYKGKTVIKVRVRTLDRLFEEELKDVSNVDVISVDVEGGELDVLRGFTKKQFYPKLFVIECPYENRWEEESLVLKGMGYSLDKKVIHNHIYLRG
jgi:FkbM family methyltransferase